MPLRGDAFLGRRPYLATPLLGDALARRRLFLGDAPSGQPVDLPSFRWGPRAVPLCVDFEFDIWSTPRDGTEADMIYPILDSAWVSLVQVVPKKGGMTVIYNEKK